MTIPGEAEGDVSMSAESFALEHTPTWAVAAVCVVFIALSLLMQRGLQRLGTWLIHSHKKPLYEALEKMKEELMLLGFISLLLTAAQNPMSRVCMPASWANQMLPCHFRSADTAPRSQPPLSPGAPIHNVVIHRSTILSTGPADQLVRRRNILSSPNQNEELVRRRNILSEPNRNELHRMLSGVTDRNFCSKDHVPLMSTESLHQLHIFIFVMAVVHVFYSCFTMLFGFTQLRNWRKWEEETNVDNYNYTAEIQKSFDEETFRNIPFRKMGLRSLRRQSTFVTSRTMAPWSTSTYGIWFNSFFRQFGKSVTKSDYLTLRLGFIKNHNAPMHLNFHRYIMTCLEDDLKTVIGISGYLWVFVIFFMFLNVHGWYAYFWMSFIPVLINLVIGAKLQHVITQLAMETAHAHGIVAAPIKPRDELFWFNNPHVLLYLIHFVLFQNAFELAFCIWLVTTFGFNSCFFDKHGFIISRVFVGIFAQVLCSYRTLPLYALVSQMGSHYKRAIFADPVSTAVTDWRNKAKANIRQSRHSNSNFHARRDSEHRPEAEGSGHCHSNFHVHSDNDPKQDNHSQMHQLYCSSSLLVTSEGEIRSQAHHNNCLTHPVNASQPQIDADTKSELGASGSREYCGECERLSLTLHVDMGDCEGNVEHRDSNLGEICPSKSHHLGGNPRRRAAYIKISSEDTNDGFPRWSLECNECKSFRALTVQSSLFKSDGGQNVQDQNMDDHGDNLHHGGTSQSPGSSGAQQLHGKTKSIFLKMSRESDKCKNGASHEPAETYGKSDNNAIKGPSLDRMRRLPSRELREIERKMGTAEVARGQEAYKPDMDIPELMMCAMLNDPREVVEFRKSTSFSSISTTAAAASSSSHLQPHHGNSQSAHQAMT